MYCSISSQLDDGWNLGLTDLNAQDVINPFSQAFFRLPRRLTKCIEEPSVSFLFSEFLDWRDQISRGLQLEPAQNTQAEFYFQKERETREEYRHNLLRKSIIWTLFEMFWFSHDQKTEWLGAYKAVDSTL
ncbi:MAG: hypothetical protein AAFO84_05270, partial [Cyanobacteria bacterium J06598_1]